MAPLIIHDTRLVGAIDDLTPDLTNVSHLSTEAISDVLEEH